jgi:hypothetical protein
VEAVGAGWKWSEQGGGSQSRVEVVRAEQRWSEQSGGVLYVPESERPAQYFRFNDDNSGSSIYIGPSAGQRSLSQVRTCLNTCCCR